ncbi:MULTISPECIES: lysine exporter LysO family protein [Marinobacter]|uniref:lysine exporter LysO family protein n=1 Tax=Marinobacter TaxID=2742 RepID=UPI000DAE33BE|nr:MULTISPECIES: lysine exporter LysO family protein [Marinobacter]
MLAGALLILVPLFVGFAFHINNPRLLAGINHGVEGLVYLILGLLGVSLGQLEGLAGHLARMGGQVSLLVGALAVANLAGLWLWQRWQPMVLEPEESGEGPLSYRRLFLGALKPLLSVVAGMLLGYAVLPALGWIEDLASAALMLLLLLIGLQLRNAGLSLRRLLMNRQGVGIAVTLAITSLLAGLAIAPFYDLPLLDVLALTSGFGWYSLSGIVVGDALGPAWGGVAFLNDVFREIIALVLIPLVIGRRPAVAIGYGGATAMDFTLPIIRRSGGLACVPVAIASGFILSFVSPILMGLFLAG